MRAVQVDDGRRTGSGRGDNSLLHSRLLLPTKNSSSPGYLLLLLRCCLAAISLDDCLVPVPVAVPSTIEDLNRKEEKENVYCHLLQCELSWESFVVVGGGGRRKILYVSVCCALTAVCIVSGKMGRKTCAYKYCDTFYRPAARSNKTNRRRRQTQRLDAACVSLGGGNK